MTHLKNKALLDLYNHIPKHETNKHFKTMDLVDNIIPKAKPLYIPEQVINYPHSTKNKTNFSALTPVNDRPGGYDPNYALNTMPTQRNQTLADRL